MAGALLVGARLSHTTLEHRRLCSVDPPPLPASTGWLALLSGVLGAASLGEAGVQSPKPPNAHSPTPLAPISINKTRLLPTEALMTVRVRRKYRAVQATRRRAHGMLRSGGPGRRNPHVHADPSLRFAGRSGCGGASVSYSWFHVDRYAKMLRF